MKYRQIGDIVKRSIHGHPPFRMGHRRWKKPRLKAIKSLSRDGESFRIDSAGCKLPAVSDGSLPAQPPLRQRRDCGQTSGAAVANDGRRRQALHRGRRHLVVGQQRPGGCARHRHGLLWGRTHAGDARRRLHYARAFARPENPGDQCRRPHEAGAKYRSTRTG